MSLLDAILLDPYKINVWIAYRTDGVAGTGTQNDPFNGSTAAKFDAIMNSLAANTTVFLGPSSLASPFLTTGFWANSDGTTGSGWQAKAGMKIVGSGIDVTFLQLTGAASPVSGTRHYFAVGHTLSSSTVDYFEISNLTIDCNSFQTGTNFACGAVRVMGNHTRVRRIKVIDWGTKTTTRPCLVIAVVTADPPSGVAGVTDCGIEDCIALSPTESPFSTGPCTVFHAGSADDSGSYPSGEGYGKGPFIRNCFADCDLGSPFSLEMRGLSISWCKAGVVEGNQIYNAQYGGPHISKSSSRDLVVRNNFYKNVTKGPFWNLGNKSSNTKTLSTLTFSSLAVGYEATATTTAAHFFNVGDRVQILCNPSSLNGTFVVTSVTSSTVFKYKTSTNGTFVSGTAASVFGIGKLVVEGNTIELATGSTGLIGIHLDDNTLASQAPDYAHGEVIIRDNRIRYVDGAFDSSYTGYGIQSNGAKNLLVQNNVVKVAPSNPIRNNRCGSVAYFNDQTPAGTLIQGINEANSNKKYDELATDAEDAFVLALLKRG